MHRVTCHLKSEAPYSQSRNYEMLAPKEDKESSADYEKRTWRYRLHSTTDGKVLIPGMAFARCIQDGAKFLSIQKPGKGKQTWTKHFEAGVIVPDPLILDISADDVPGEWLYLNADGRRGGSRRVWRCMPVLPQWEGLVTFIIVDDEITEEVFEQHLSEAGVLIGIGRYRPRNGGMYGRFSLKEMDWK